MRHKREISTIARLKEEAQARNKSKHSMRAHRIRKSNRNQESSHDNTREMQPRFLAPRACAAIHEIGNNTSQRTKHDIQQAEHSCPATGTGLSEVFEVLEIIRAENGIDGEFGAEGAEVAGGDD